MWHSRHGISALVKTGRRASLVAQQVKNLPANAGDSGDVGLIPGLGRSPGKEMATHSSVLA